MYANALAVVCLVQGKSLHSVDGAVAGTLSIGSLSMIGVLFDNHPGTRTSKGAMLASTVVLLAATTYCHVAQPLHAAFYDAHSSRRGL
jgi:hypothetical protein